MSPWFNGKARVALGAVLDVLQPTRIVYVEEQRAQANRVLPTALGKALSDAELRELTVKTSGDLALVTDHAGVVAQRVLAAAAEAGVADVSIDVVAHREACFVTFRVRAIDRSLVQAFTKAIDISALRKELEAAGGGIEEAFSKHAIFRLALRFPWR